VLCLAYDMGARTLSEQWFAMASLLVAVLLYATIVATVVAAMLHRREHNLLSTVNELLCIDQVPDRAASTR
jgi:hypothetical protein